MVVMIGVARTATFDLPDGNFGRPHFRTINL